MNANGDDYISFSVLDVICTHDGKCVVLATGMCVCERERESARERLRIVNSVCVCVRERERRMCVFVCVYVCG